MKDMKLHRLHNYIQCLLFLIGASVIVSCSDEEVANSNYRIKEGVPVTVSFGFDVQKSNIVSRSAATEAQ